jgi:cytochrome P450
MNTANEGGARELPGAFVLGHLQDFRKQRLVLLERVASECGALGWIRLGPLRALVVSDPALAREVLVERQEEFTNMPPRGMDGVKRLFGHSVLVSNGSVHREQRKRATSSLARPRMLAIVDQVVAEVEAWQARWSEGQELELYEELLGLVTRIAQRVLFGEKADAGSSSELPELLRAAVGYAIAEVGRAVPLPGWVPSAHNRGFRKLIDALDDYVLALIRRRRASGGEGDDVLSALLAGEGASLSDQELRDDLIALFVAGNEAMATTLFWALYHLTTADELGRELTAAIEGALGAERPGSDALSTIVLASQLFKEATRLYPPGHLILRSAKVDLTLGDTAVRAGVLVFVNGYAIQRDPRFFEAPLQFRPQRFEQLNDRELARVFFPFSAGPRTCVGNHFSLTQGPVTLLSLWQRSRFEPLTREKPAVGTGFALYPQGGWRVRVFRR